jgi:hypothetical protein
MGNQPKIVNGEAMELPASGYRIMDPEAAKSSGNVVMEKEGSRLLDAKKPPSYVATNGAGCCHSSTLTQ